MPKNRGKLYTSGLCITDGPILVKRSGAEMVFLDKIMVENHVSGVNYHLCEG